MTTFKTLDGLFPDDSLFCDPELFSSGDLFCDDCRDTTIPKSQWQDYLLLPKDENGFSDTQASFAAEIHNADDAIYTIMARHCVRLNRTLMMLCSGMKKRDTLQPVIDQFDAIYDSALDLVGEGRYYDSTEAYKARLPFKRGDLPDTPRAAAQMAGQLLYHQASQEFENIIVSYDFFQSDELVCRKHFYAYLGQSLAAFLLAAEEPFPTFVAYPFYCYDLFSHVNQAEGGTDIRDIDYDIPPAPRGEATDTSLAGTPVIDCLCAIHLPTMTKQDLYLEGGALHKIRWGTLDNLICVTKEVEPQFDLSDMDEYV